MGVTEKGCFIHLEISEYCFKLDRLIHDLERGNFAKGGAEKIKYNQRGKQTKGILLRPEILYTSL